MLKQKPSFHLFFILSLIAYLLIGYTVDRHETLPLFVAYYALFLVYAGIIIKHASFSDHEFRYWIIAAIIFRAVLLFAVPALSDDFYRFIWDGRLLSAGYHPFAEIPAFYMASPHQIPGINAELYDQLNAKDTYTVYPPVAQLIFWIAAKISPQSVYGSMLVMKTISFVFEMATLWLLPKVLREFRMPSTPTLMYALNPLVIMELTGNVHHEGIMLFFLLLAVYLLRQEKKTTSTVAYALAVCTKLIPLLFLPLLFRHLGWKKVLRYWALTGAFTLLFFLPLMKPEIIYGMATSIGYYFQRFEFNASLYYLIRAAGYALAGFNIIQYAGPIMAAAATILILYIAFRKGVSSPSRTIDISLFKEMLICLTIYFLSVTILHPWYIITLFGISLFTHYQFPLVWTALIFLTYAGYTDTGFSENLTLVALEYLVVLGYLLYETVWTKRRVFS